MEICKRKLRPKLHLLAVAVHLLFWTSGSGLAVDNATNPTNDVAGLCNAAYTLCEDACGAAKYTEAQRSGCLSNCKAIALQCQGLAATRGGAQQGVGDLGTGGVLQDETIKKKKKRKTGVKQ